MTELATPARSLIIERQMPRQPEKVWRAPAQSPLIGQRLMRHDFMPLAT